MVEWVQYEQELNIYYVIFKSINHYPYWNSHLTAGVTCKAHETIRAKETGQKKNTSFLPK